MKKSTKLYFTADIHGSQKCFYKFINAGKFYGVNVLIMGGDITGKAIIFIEKDKNGNYNCTYMGNHYKFQSISEVDEFVKLVKINGYYPYIAEKGEIETYLKNDKAMNELFIKLMSKTISEWMEIAENRLKNTGIRCFIMIGNDDPPVIKNIINQSSYVIDPEDKVIAIDDYHDMISIGLSNPTPWHTPRECSEEELTEKIDKLMTEISNPNTSILCAHVPPYGTGLDDAPKLTDSLQVISKFGQVQFSPAGSTAVLNAIKKYQYLLSLHGHIHEVHAIKKIGKTVCINPGSDYGEGVLHGVVVVLDKNRLLSYQLVSG
ncbi:metallophosphoesterase [Thermoanaerobacterium sp. RBIITD]|uniref:metallophosphoesterase family protein n=1 Tax=Thermoanaerobacterium sp. RBIITD TaxID=1550240 RepID=UPI000BB78A0F|nr:metallophosphoesterase [Thermoanaerobacterium sp. RBIITD]SNX54669.1 Calcineurin-like phosphoesterase [Thermoanaerobacterium sp. RBIITD]